ncbi:MAG: M15 family metallopeptidase [Eubacteriales bacterium]|nr:M15 family metallopeptidase [Eubacteriales bacterium]
MNKKLTGSTAALLLGICLMGAPAGAVQLQQTSGQTDRILAAADQAALLPDSMDSQLAADAVTREQACSLAVRLYASLSNVSYDALMEQDAARRIICPFTDTKSADVQEAWALELVSEEGATIDPSGTVTRQELITMLYRAIQQSSTGTDLSNNEIAQAIYTFSDGQYVPDWAQAAMGYFVRQGLTSGIGENRLGVGEQVSAEQAAVLTYRAAAALHTGRGISSSADLSQISMHSGTTAVSWSGSGADYYLVYFYQNDGYTDAPVHTEQISAESNGAQEMQLPDAIADTPGIWYWSVDGFDCDGKLIAVSNNVAQLAVTAQPEITTQTTDDDIVPGLYGSSENNGGTTSERIISATIPAGMTYAGESYSSKVARIFGEGSSYHLYSGASEAQSHQVTITVNVWDFDSNGNKVTRTRSLQIHEALAASVQQIFAEIYAGEEQFPIRTLGGYNWRGNGSTSEHCLGTAIDINWDENYMCTNSGQALTGSHWSPGSDPYSIPANSEVVQIFAKYGFGWGGTWNSKKDYMHFSYFGT